MSQRRSWSWRGALAGLFGRPRAAPAELSRLRGRALAFESLEARIPLAAYNLVRLVDPETSNIEYRAVNTVNGAPFHFLSVLQTPQGAIGVRPHPDLADPDGWGGTWYVSPFLATGSPSGGRLKNVIADDSGVYFTTGGLLGRTETTTAGVWAATLHFVYDAAAQRINGSGALAVTLDAPLASLGTDLNVFRIASNYLDDVNVPNVGVVDTGDMRDATVRYGAGSPQDFTWVPPVQPGHFPTDQAATITTSVNGELNRLDPVFQLDSTRPRKPSMALAMTAQTAGVSQIAGLAYDTSKSKDLFADNVGVHTIVRQGTSATSLRFNWAFESTPTNIPLAAGGPAATAGMPDTLAPFYRAYNKSLNFHFFTGSQAEHSVAVGAGLRAEGNSFQGMTALRDGAVPLFRLYNVTLGYHYYTATPSELQTLVGLGWRYEGVEAFVYPSGQTPPAPATDLFRLYNLNTGTHLLTTNFDEALAVLAIVDPQGNHPWVLHSSVGFAFAPSGAAVPAPPHRTASDDEGAATDDFDDTGMDWADSAFALLADDESWTPG